VAVHRVFSRSEGVNSAIISVRHNALVVFDNESLTCIPVAARIGVLSSQLSKEICEISIVHHRVPAVV